MFDKIDWQVPAGAVARADPGVLHAASAAPVDGTFFFVLMKRIFFSLRIRWRLSCVAFPLSGGRVFLDSTFHIRHLSLLPSTIAFHNTLFFAYICFLRPTFRELPAQCSQHFSMLV